MKLLSIEKIEETSDWYITQAKFKRPFKKDYFAICVTSKFTGLTEFMNSGEIVSRLQHTFEAFLQSKHQKIVFP